LDALKEQLCQDTTQMIDSIYLEAAAVK